MTPPILSPRRNGRLHVSIQHCIEKQIAGEKVMFMCPNKESAKRTMELFLSLGGKKGHGVKFRWPTKRHKNRTDKEQFLLSRGDWYLRTMMSEFASCPKVKWEIR